MEKICEARFSQNPALRQALIDTEGTQLVEASPYDRIWGAGLAASDARLTDPTTWPGLNLLGQVLDRVRDRLIDAEVSNNALTRQIHDVQPEDDKERKRHGQGKSVSERVTLGEGRSIKKKKKKPHKKIK